MESLNRRTWIIGALALVLAGCEKSDDAPVNAAPISNARPAAVSNARAASVAASTPKLAPTLGTVQRDTELKAKPSSAAKMLKRLPRGAPVTVVDRDGGWFNVTSGTDQGWV